MLSSLSQYYAKKPQKRRQLYDIIEGSSPLSLRIIDWFVTHHARATNVTYWIDETNNVLVMDPPNDNSEYSRSLRKFNLYLDYRAQLQSYTKMFFDPFRRYDRITFVLEATPLTTIETTVGQLNFFRWALENNVIDYISEHISDIEDCMASFHKTVKAGEKDKDKEKDKEKDKPRAPCSRSLPAPLHTVVHTPHFIHFD